MKILFLCSGSSGVSPIVTAQAESLSKAFVEVEIVSISGKGFVGYIRSVPVLNMQISLHNPDVVHAHYSLCGIVAAIASSRPIITSLMGSDVKSSSFWRVVIRFFIRYIWDATIVKSEDMRRSLGVNSDKVHIIPNGVDLDIFRPLDKSECRKKLGWNDSIRVILFAANPDRHEKNFKLAKESFMKADLHDAELKVVYKVKHEDIPYYLCASDVLISTSKWEGSPNIIKEAMACNIPIVSTDVGDVSSLADGIDSIWICEENPHKIAKAVIGALEYAGNICSRNKLRDIGLDSLSTAQRITTLYNETIAR